jgi:hypothetical protein
MLELVEWRQRTFYPDETVEDLEAAKKSFRDFADALI